MSISARVATIAALVVALLVGALDVSRAHAGHETRNGVLGEAGLDVLLVVLVLVAAVVVLAAFAMAVLRWERRDARAEAAEAGEPGGGGRRPE